MAACQAPPAATTSLPALLEITTSQHPQQHVSYKDQPSGGRHVKMSRTLQYGCRHRQMHLQYSTLERDSLIPKRVQSLPQCQRRPLYITSYHSSLASPCCAVPRHAHMIATDCQAGYLIHIILSAGRHDEPSYQEMRFNERCSFRGNEHSFMLCAISCCGCDGVSKALRSHAHLKPWQVADSIARSRGARRQTMLFSVSRGSKSKHFPRGSATSA